MMNEIKVKRRRREWGLVLKSDEGEGSFKAISVRESREGD